MIGRSCLFRPARLSGVSSRSRAGVLEARSGQCSNGRSLLAVRDDFRRSFSDPLSSAFPDDDARYRKLLFGYEAPPVGSRLRKAVDNEGVWEGGRPRPYVYAYRSFGMIVGRQLILLPVGLRRVPSGTSVVRREIDADGLFSRVARSDRA